MREQRLPLGIDIGTAGIRIAELILPGPTLHNVAAIPIPPGANEAQIGALLAELLGHLHTKERRCVLILDDRDAIIRAMSFPPMSSVERRRAASIEAERFSPSELPHSVHLSRANEATFAVGTVTNAAIERLQRIVRFAKLRVVGIDHAAYAFERAFAHCDAVVDIGVRQTRFYALRAPVPFSQSLEIGGEHFTRAIARSFAIDEESAEGRKRMHGIAPAGEAETAAIVHFVGRAMRSARTSGATEIERILLTGNGARMPLLPGRLERDTGCLVEIATRLDHVETSFPGDVVRSAAPEWALACGAALWSIAEEAAA